MIMMMALVIFEMGRHSERREIRKQFISQIGKSKSFSVSEIGILIIPGLGIYDTKGEKP